MRSSPPILRSPLLPLLLLVGCALGNHPPTLSPVGARVVKVGETLEILLEADDEDGDELSFGMRFLDALPPQAAQLEPVSKQSARFHWSPLISESSPTGRVYSLRLYVEDGYGGSDQEEIQVTVYRQEGLPVFLTPKGYVLDLAERQSLRFVVQVKDDDSSKVAISFHSGPAGAELDALDGKSAEFYWRPEPEQIAEKLFHAVTFAASDGDHAPVLHDVGIALVNASTEACSGGAPTLSHQPPMDVQGGTDLTLEVLISDAESHVRLPTLHYWTDTLGSAEAPVDVALTSDAGSRHHATLYGIGGQGAGELVRYWFTALDDDDPTSDRCDHTARLPKTGSYMVGVHPGSGPGACVNDAFESNDLSAVIDLELDEPVVRRLCEGDEDLFLVQSDFDQPYVVHASNIGWNGHLALQAEDYAGQVVAASTVLLEGASLEIPARPEADPLTVRVWSSSTENLSYEARLTSTISGCPADEFEPNDTQATAKAVLSGTKAELVVCPADIDLFLLPVPAGHNVDARIAFRHQLGDLDMMAIDPGSGQAIAVSESLTDDERILLEGDKLGGMSEIIIGVVGYQGASNQYELSLITGDDSTICVEDGVSPNHEPSAAVSILEGVLNDLRLCPGSPDWYRLDLNGGETIEWIVAEDNLLTDMVTAEGLSAEGEALEGDCEATDADFYCLFHAPSPGTVRLGLTSQTTVPMRYGFQIVAYDPLGDCTLDRYEPNDTPETAPDLPMGVLTHLKICPNDHDWFAIQLSSGQTLAVAIFQSPTSDGTMDVALLDDTGRDMLAASQPTETDWSRLLQYTAPDNQSLRVHVYSTGAQNGTYDLLVGVQ